MVVASATQAFNRYNPPSPSLASDDGRDDTNFDVNQLRDELPQPFRRINKVLDDIFESAWEIIHQHEVENNYRQSTKKSLEAVVYEEERLLNNVHVTTMCSSEQFLIIGCADGGISAVQLPELNTVAHFDGVGRNAVSALKLLASGEDWVIFSSLFEQGGALVAGLYLDEFHVIHEFPSDGLDVKLVEDVFISEDSEYIAVDFVEVSTSKHSVEVYKLPIATWSEEILKIKKQEVEEGDNSEKAVEDTETRSEITSAMSNTPQMEATKSNNANRNQSGASNISGISRKKTDLDATTVPSSLSNHSELNPNASNIMEAHFSKISHLLTVHPPSINPCQQNILSALKAVSADSNVIGSGVHHLLTPTYFESFANLLTKPTRAQSGKSGSQAESYQFSPVVTSAATVHYLKGQQFSSLFPTKEVADSYNGIAVWWKNGNQCFIYSLKSKETEAKPVSVLPQASPIHLTAVNRDTNLIAFLLRNKCLTVWNRFTAQPLQVMKPITEGEITCLNFSSVTRSLTELDCLSYSTNKGKLWQMVCHKDKILEPQLLDDRSSKLFEDDRVTKICSSPKNQLCAIWKSGNIVMYDEAKTRSLCRLELFHQESNIEGDGDDLLLSNRSDYIMTARVERKRVDGNIEKLSTRLFIFHPSQQNCLRQFTIEKPPLEKLPEVETLKEHFAAFLKERKKLDPGLMNRAQKRRQQFLKMNWKDGGSPRGKSVQMVS